MLTTMFTVCLLITFKSVSLDNPRDMQLRANICFLCLILLLCYECTSARMETNTAYVTIVTTTIVFMLFTMQLLSY